jgi:putative membrane protein
MINKPAIVILMTLSLPLAAVAEEIPAATFAEKAAQTDMFEMEAAKLVLDKGVSDKVKKFAGDMVKDHHRTTVDLTDAATKDGVQLPGDMGDELRTKLNSLKPLNGPALDAAYVSTQVSVHTEAVQLFDAFVKDGEAGALKSFATSYYPTIRMHLVRIRNFNVEQ